MENQKGSSDGEDIPSDFFDEFSTDEFIEGLSVVDSWDDADKKRQGRTRINAEDVNRVDDLRDLIARDKDVEGKVVKDKFRWRDKGVDGKIVNDRFKWRRIPQQPQGETSDERRSSSASRMDEYIKPGSRRDPSKTNEAIKRDKEEKVKEHLAKRLESSDEIRPPGTELDDFFDATKEAKKQSSEAKASVVSPPKERVQKRQESPVKHRAQVHPARRQHWSPQRPHQTYSPRRSPRHSPRRSPRRYSPRRFSPRRFSPSRNRKNMRFSPRRPSPELRRRRSRSPNKHPYRRSRSRSPNFRDRAGRRRSRSRSRDRRREDDDFLHPKNYYPPEFSPKRAPVQFPGPPAPLFPGPPALQYGEPMIMEYPGGVPPGFAYPQPTPYGGYPAPFEFGGPPAVPMLMPGPQPVPAPVLDAAGPAPVDMVPGMVPSVMPAIVPPPQPIPPPMASDSLIPRWSKSEQPPPPDALEKLVAEGILSHEDYLKLTPNKGVSTAMDTQARVAVLNRCNDALSRIGVIINKIPAHLGINNNMLTAGGPEQKFTPPKFCSPLKRQPTTDFFFTNSEASTVSKRNKQIIETLIEKLNLENAIGKRRRKTPKGMKDAETQTTKPFCDMCDIRESTTSNEIGTSIDREHIFTSVHTQVVEHDLISSKAVFNPSGSVLDGAPISIAHMTPAQLVSQLAARAKTFKQADPEPRSSNQFRNPHNSYDGRGGKQYQHYGENSDNYDYRY